MRQTYPRNALVAEYVNGAAVGSPTREYIYSGAALLATIEGGATTYHHQDQLSIRANTNSAGAMVGQQGNYPFGMAWYSSSTTTKWRFTRSTLCAPRPRSGRARSGQAGLERDVETALDHTWFRQYSSTFAAV